MDYAPTGDLSAFGPAEISAAADYPGDAEIFAQALRDTGWIDEDGSLHDWYDYAGKLIERKEVNKERMKEARARIVQATCETRVGLPNLTLPNQERREEAPPPEWSPVEQSENQKTQKPIKQKPTEFSHEWLSIPEFSKVWCAWLEVRAKKKVPSTAHALGLAMSKLEKLSNNNPVDAVDFINESILSGWTSFFPKRQQFTKQNSPPPLMRL